MEANYLKLITVEDSDYSSPNKNIISACENIANFLYHNYNEKNIRHVNMLINSISLFFTCIKKCSGYDQKKMSEFIEQANRNPSLDKNHLPKIIEILNNSFQHCYSEKDISDLRGFTVEYFAQLCYSKHTNTLITSHTKNYLCFGKALVVKPNNCIYIRTNENLVKKSVDIIFFTQNKLECVEVKVVPRGFQFENVLLFLEIYSNFEKYTNKSTLIFYSWGESYEIKNRVYDICSDYAEDKITSILDTIDIKVKCELIK